MTHNPRESLSNWASIIGAAMLVAYCAHPLLTYVLLLVDGEEGRITSSYMSFFMAGLIAVFLIAAYVLKRRLSPRLRFEAATLWGGLLMWATIPFMVLSVWLAAHISQDGGTAAFFMLLIFGGYCAIMGTILLIVSRVMRHKRLEAEWKTPWIKS